MGECFKCCDERIPLVVADAFECGGFIPLPRLGESNGFVERNDDQALGSAVVCNRIGHVINETPVSSAGRSVKASGPDSVAGPSRSPMTSAASRSLASRNWAHTLSDVGDWRDRCRPLTLDTGTPAASVSWPIWDKYGTTQISDRASRNLMPIYLVWCGAQNRNRTDDLRITNALLYRLSYLGALQAQGVMLSVGSDRHDDDSSGGAASGSRPFHWPVES